MDPESLRTLEFWGMLAVIMGGFGAACGAWRSMGKIEGMVGRFCERLDKHSKAIDAHEVKFVRLETMPERLSQLNDRVDKGLSQLGGKIDDLNASIQSLTNKGADDGSRERKR